MATSKKSATTKATVTEKTATTAVETPVVETAATETPVVAPVASTVDALTAKIKEYGGDEHVLDTLYSLGVESVDDLAELTENDLVSAGLKLVKARKLLDNVKTAKKVAETPVTAAATAPAPMITADYNSLLPTLPSEESLLNSLKTGGVLKVGQSAYISGLRVYIADRLGLFGIPKTAAEAMEKYADECEEPVPAAFFQLKKQITRREYGDLFAAIDGLDGSFATEARRKEFLRRVRTDYCPAIRDAYIVLDNWYKAVLAANSNPASLMAAIAGAMNGAAGVTMAANMPSTDPVKDAADSLKDAINKSFRGTGLPVANAMAYDAANTIKCLNDPSLPLLMGVPNKEQMLKKLGVNITPNYARIEQNLVRFVLSYIVFSDEGAGNEVAYLTALWQLGQQIPWDEVVGGTDGVTTIGGRSIL